MRIRWTRAAAADLENISNYLKDRHPEYREPTVRKLYEGIRALKGVAGAWPHRARERDKRASVSASPLYRVYRVKEQSIQILRIYHGAQGRP
jgi:plasmid stabilization system protein ParE